MQRPTIDLNASGAPTRNSAMPDITTALPWRRWEDGLAEAGERGVPIFAFAEPSWTNSAQRVALLLQQDDRLRALIPEHVVPVLVDPDQRPDLAARWRHAAARLSGSAGPPLMVFLTHEGDPILSYCTMTIEGDKTFPSLASLIESLAERYTVDPGPILADAASLDLTPVPPDLEPDLEHGGLDELPRHAKPGILWDALDELEHGPLPPERETWLRTTLRNIARGGTYDHLDRGFHRCAREAGWVVPHFEKPIPLNAALGTVYARAGSAFDEPSWRDLAGRTLTFCAAALADGVDAIGSDTTYYTWTSKEFLDNLEPSLVQVASLHYGIMPVDLRQSLRRVVEIENMDRYSHEDPEQLRTRLMRARVQLRSVRQRRPSPQVISSQALSWRAESIRWMLVASRWHDAVDVPATTGALEQLIAGRFDPALGYGRHDGAWLEDQAALLAAFVAADRATGDERWSRIARDLAAILKATWRLGDGWRDRPDSDVPSVAVVDDMVSAAIPTLEAALADLGNTP